MWYIEYTSFCNVMMCNKRKVENRYGKDVLCEKMLSLLLNRRDAFFASFFHFYGERDFIGNSILDMNRNRRKYNLMEGFILYLLLRLLRCLVPINDQSKFFLYLSLFIQLSENLKRYEGSLKGAKYRCQCHPAHIYNYF